MKQLTKKTTCTEYRYDGQEMGKQSITETYIGGLMVTRETKNTDIDMEDMAVISHFHYNDKGQMVMEEVFNVDPAPGGLAGDNPFVTHMFENAEESDGGYTRARRYGDDGQYGEEVQYDKAGRVVRVHNRDVYMQDENDMEGILVDVEKFYDSEGRLTDENCLSDVCYSHLEYVEEGYHKGRILKYESYPDEEAFTQEEEDAGLTDDAMESLSTSMSVVGSFERDADGRMSRLVLNGKETVYEYDREGDLIKETTTSEDYGNVSVTTTSYIYE